MHRIAALLESGDIQPWEILAVTFTNKAARELRERCAGMVGNTVEDLWVGTFHGIGARLLRRHAASLGFSQSFTIFDADDQLRLLKELLADAGLDDTIFRPDVLRRYIDTAKNEARSPEKAAAMAADSVSSECASLYARYQNRLARLDALDFGDLIVKTLQVVSADDEIGRRYRDRFRHVLVDEYQDINHAQYLLVRALAGGSGNLCVVGDDDQSIYGWRGADRRNILEFERDFPGAKVVRLEQNYRSTQNIIEAAAALIDNNHQRHAKRMWTEAEAGELLTVYTAADERDEARYIITEIAALGEKRGGAAVFYRTNAQSRAIEETLVRFHIPYVIVGGTRFYERREIKDLIAYLRFVQNPADDLSLERIVNTPPRGIGKVTWERLRLGAEAASISIWEHLQDDAALDGVAAQARRRLREFREAARDWIGAREHDVTELVRRLIEESGYLAYLESRPEDDPSGRIENVNELVTVAQNFDAEASSFTVTDEDPELPPLARFLEQLTLAADVDSYQTRGQAVTLMTVHNSKGLEFDDVFVAGVEEGIFPHARSLDDDEAGIEEERRLCYVAMTRARRRLTLCHARRRHVFGTSQFNFASRFLDEIPDERLVRERSDIEHGVAPTGRFDENLDQRPPNEWSNDAAAPTSRPARASKGAYQPGMKVVHPMFGSGRVRSSEGEGETEKLIVQFDRVGVKKLMAGFARLEIVTP